MRCILILIIFTFLFFNCNENTALAVDRIIDNRPIEGKQIAEKEIKIGDNLPKFIYHKIVELPFVKERISALDEKEIEHIFWVNKSEQDTNKIDIQILAENEISWLPIYNFMYDFKNEKLFHLDISKQSLNDTLILIE